MSKHILVETIVVTKHQYLIIAPDAIAATDAVTMGEVEPFETHVLNETIVGVSEIGLKEDGCYDIPNIDPVVEAKKLSSD